MSERAKGYDEFRRGWPVVLSAMLGIGLGLSPVPFYTIGVFAPVLAREFGWSFGSIMQGIIFSTLSVIVFSPLVGLLADHFGVRRVALVSVTLFGLSFMGFALSNGSLPLYYANWTVLAILGTGTLPITWTRAVNNWFDLRKGFALGLCLFGTGLFGYLVKPFTAWVIEGYGWRMAYVAIGALPLLIALPVAVWGFHDVGPASQTAALRKSGEAARKAATPGLKIGQILSSWRFWVIAAACIMIAFAVGGAIANMENILRLSGFSRSDIVSLASLIGLAVIVGRVLGGWLLDQFWAPAVAAVLLGIPSSAFWILAHGPHGYAASGLAVFEVGFAAGVEYDLLAYLISRYFGLKSYNVIYAAIYGAFALGAAVGPVVFGKYYDLTGSYRSPLLLSAAMMVASALLLLTLGRYRSFADQPLAAPAATEAVPRPA
jgi:predicted MFS family arabinose efflux permease